MVNCYCTIILLHLCKEYLTAAKLKTSLTPDKVLNVLTR